MSADELKKKALRLLARREHSMHEIRKKLADPAAESSDIEAAIAWLLEHDYLNQQRYAEMVVRHRAGLGYGPAWIKAHLQSQDIDEAMISAAFSAEPQDWSGIVNQLRQSKGRGKRPDQWKRFLFSRGLLAFDDSDECLG